MDVPCKRNGPYQGLARGTVSMQMMPRQHLKQISGTLGGSNVAN